MKEMNIYINIFFFIFMIEPYPAHNPNAARHISDCASKAEAEKINK